MGALPGCREPPRMASREARPRMASHRSPSSQPGRRAGGGARLVGKPVYRWRCRRACPGEIKVKGSSPAEEGPTLVDQSEWLGQPKKGWAVRERPTPTVEAPLEPASPDPEGLTDGNPLPVTLCQVPGTRGARRVVSARCTLALGPLSPSCWPVSLPARPQWGRGERGRASLGE